MSLVCHINVVPDAILKEIFEYSHGHMVRHNFRKNDKGALDLVCKRWRYIVNTSDLCKYMIALTRNTKSPCRLVCSFLKEIVYTKSMWGRANFYMWLNHYELLRLQHVDDPTLQIINRGELMNDDWEKDIVELSERMKKYAPTIRIDSFLVKVEKAQAGELRLIGTMVPHYFLELDAVDFENILCFFYMHDWHIGPDRGICETRFGESEEFNRDLWKRLPMGKPQEYRIQTGKLLDYMVANARSVIEQLRRHRSTIDDLV